MYQFHLIKHLMILIEPQFNTLEVTKQGLIILFELNFIIFFKHIFYETSFLQKYPIFQDLFISILLTYFDLILLIFLELFLDIFTHFITFLALVILWFLIIFTHQQFFSF